MGSAFLCSALAVAADNVSTTLKVPENGYKVAYNSAITDLKKKALKSVSSLVKHTEVISDGELSDLFTSYKKGLVQLSDIEESMDGDILKIRAKYIVTSIDYNLFTDDKAVNESLLALKSKNTSLYKSINVITDLYKLKSELLESIKLSSDHNLSKLKQNLQLIMINKKIDELKASIKT